MQLLGGRLIYLASPTGFYMVEFWALTFKKIKNNIFQYAYQILDSISVER